MWKSVIEQKDELVDIFQKIYYISDCIQMAALGPGKPESLSLAVAGLHDLLKSFGEDLENFTEDFDTAVSQMERKDEQPRNGR